MFRSRLLSRFLLPALTLGALALSAVRHTREYLQRFEAEAARAGNSAELITAMQRAYPQAGLGIALDIGAKVNKGEMKW